MLIANLEYLNAPAPAWVGVLFVACTGLAAVLLARVVKRAGGSTGRYWLLVGTWLAIQAGLGLAGFYYQHLEALPPRLLLGTILPTSVIIVGIFVSARGRRWVAGMPLADLVAVSVVRVGVELGLYSLAACRLVPQLMTFEGRNFDILAGLTALVVAALARKQRVSRPWLLVWHLVALGLLVNIVGLALFSAPTPAQQLAFEQPNVAVLRFPFVWLPAFIVPVVLFSHVASLYKLLRQRSVVVPGMTQADITRLELLY